MWPIRLKNYFLLEMINLSMETAHRFSARLYEQFFSCYVYRITFKTIIVGMSNNKRIAFTYHIHRGVFMVKCFTKSKNSIREESYCLNLPEHSFIGKVKRPQNVRKTAILLQFCFMNTNKWWLCPYQSLQP